MNKSLKILLLSSEAVPFAKVGGLADVAGSLPKALRQLGHDARLVLPKYGQINEAEFGLTRIVDSMPVPTGSGHEQRPEPFVPGRRTGPYGTVPKDQGLAEVSSKGGGK